MKKLTVAALAVTTLLSGSAFAHEAGYRPGHPEILDVTPFQRAVETARDRAVPGDVVTLSPACHDESPCGRSRQ